MMSSLFVKVDCVWEECRGVRRISLTAPGPVQSPLLQSPASICHVQASPSGQRHQAGLLAQWLLLAPGSCKTQKTKTQTQRRPLPRYPSSPLGSSHYLCHT